MSNIKARTRRPQFGKDSRQSQLQVRITEQCRDRVEELALHTNKPLNRVVEDALNQYYETVLHPEHETTAIG